MLPREQERMEEITTLPGSKKGAQCRKKPPTEGARPSLIKQVTFWRFESVSSHFQCNQNPAAPEQLDWSHHLSHSKNLPWNTRKSKEGEVVTEQSTPPNQESWDPCRNVADASIVKQTPVNLNALLSMLWSFSLLTWVMQEYFTSRPSQPPVSGSQVGLV